MVYCTPADVADYLLINLDDEDTFITAEKIQNIITIKEDLIDSLLLHSYRRTQVLDEYHTLDFTEYFTGLGYRIDLIHRRVHAFNTDDGDKVEVRESGAWRTIGEEEITYDLKPGIVYISGISRAYTNTDVVRISYHYGTIPAPGWMKDLCAKMVAVHILQTAWRLLPIPETKIDSVADTVKEWKMDVDNLIVAKQEIVVL